MSHTPSKIAARDHRCRKCERDEFACACCGQPEGKYGSWCDACWAADCGERTALEVCRDGCLVKARGA